MFHPEIELADWFITSPSGTLWIALLPRHGDYFLQRRMPFRIRQWAGAVSPALLKA